MVHEFKVSMFLTNMSSTGSDQLSPDYHVCSLRYHISILETYVLANCTGIYILDFNISSDKSRSSLCSSASDGYRVLGKFRSHSRIL